MYRDSTREGGRGSPIVIVTEFGNSGVGGRNSLCMLVLIMEFAHAGGWIDGDGDGDGGGWGMMIQG